jgi:hypothetical protein
MDKRLKERFAVIGMAISSLVGFLTVMIFSQTGFPFVFTWPYRNFVNFAIFTLGFLPFGIFIGVKAIGAHGVKSAFMKGGLWTAALASTLSLIAVLYNQIKGQNLLVYYLIFAVVILAATSSLIAGIAAIVARDFRQFNKLRIVPQFTISEMLIVTSLFALILGSIISITQLR